MHSAVIPIIPDASIDHIGAKPDELELVAPTDPGSDALIAAGLKLPTLPPWIALADSLWCYAQTHMAGGEADRLVPVIERQVELAGG